MKITNEQLSYALLRITIGMAMFGHGLVRIPKLSVFAGGMIKGYDGTLPLALVTPFAYALPFVEFAIGALLILGLLTRYALIAGALLMILLIFGCAIKENWEAIGTQLLYGGLYFILLRFLAQNAYAVDNLLRR
ncbi:thiosulfate dehydrogenase [quinone] large subunit [Chitinophaga costaii]|uniref:Thiosulfate dehydrogenase [quinone] large subunit n=1 Tax=Chitinophaga costaii TaxID=1335309 RepID=A0A1C3ZE10_9BACT|nr:DoxX family membrane protein [Chitinophaga costaii]PUZ30607.1 DoxX family membrane protein [Chitinophaga costaii]SCB80526.1 thiosulfate dehydrogenase [quinone] large subunit [Chitinophaga costaii]